MTIPTSIQQISGRLLLRQVILLQSQQLIVWLELVVLRKDASKSSKVNQNSWTSHHVTCFGTQLHQIYTLHGIWSFGIVLVSSLHDHCMFTCISALSEWIFNTVSILDGKLGEFGRIHANDNVKCESWVFHLACLWPTLRMTSSVKMAEVWEPLHGLASHCKARKNLAPLVRMKSRAPRQHSTAAFYRFHRLCQFCLTSAAVKLASAVCAKAIPPAILAMIFLASMRTWAEAVSSTNRNDEATKI